MSDIPWARFAALNFVAAGIWAVTFAGGGYLAGAALQHVVGDVVQGVGLAMLGAFLCVGFWLLHKARKPPEGAPPPN